MMIVLVFALLLFYSMWRLLPLHKGHVRGWTLTALAGAGVFVHKFDARCEGVAEERHGAAAVPRSVSRNRGSHALDRPSSKEAPARSPRHESSALIVKEEAPRGNDQVVARREGDETAYDDVEIDEDPKCPLCKFMRASPCGQNWVRWEKCVTYHKDRNEDFASPCARFTLQLAECIQREKDSFPPELRRALALEPDDDDEDDEDVDFDEADKDQ